MGVLDDAIREHLELKRQHGAPETEVDQQEAEALGPARRKAAEAAEEPAAEPAAEAPEAGPPIEPELAPEPVAEPLPPAPAPEPEDLARDAEPDWGFESEPESPAGDTPARGFERVEDAPPAKDSDDGDVLEETPDFLEETPEHDRLWFEQKPPRDFDFDE
jgi:hypothetical protein